MNPFRRLDGFMGGLALPTCKSLTSEALIEDAGIPPRLFYPLELASGHRAVPIVKVGDYVKSGTPLALCPEGFDPPICATSSGTIRLQDAILTSSSDSPMMVLETDGLDLKVPPLPPLAESERLPENVMRRLHDCGVLGMGGAGFPTAQKIRNLSGPLQILIVNGAECEPFLTCDERAIRENPAALLRAAENLAGIFNIPSIVLAVESSRSDALRALEHELASGVFTRSRLFALPDRYPAGGERQLIQAVSGFALPAGTHPVDHGILCLNVQTLLASASAIDLGACLTSRILTISGHGIQAPSNLRVLIGTPIAYLLERCGGVKEGRHHLILGGPMMGRSVPSTEIPITKTSSALLVLDDTDLPSPHIASERPCIRCGACSDACPQGLLPQSLHGQVEARRMAELESLHLLDCIECGCCDVVCPSLIPLTERFREGKKQLRRYQFDAQLAQKAQSRHQARLARIQREQSERDKEAEARKNALGQGAQPRIQEALERARLKREQRLNTSQDKNQNDAP